MISDARTLLAACLVMACGACETTRRCPEDVAAPPHVLERFNASVHGLDRLHIIGLGEVRWRDDSGRHIDQADLEAWLDGDLRTSIRLTKFGDTVGWFGSTPEHAWRFQMLREPTSLDYYPATSGKPPPKHAWPLRVLLGLDPWPADAVVSVAQGELIVTGTVSTGTFQAVLDPGTLRLLRVSLEHPDGSINTSEHFWTTGETQITGAPGARALARVVAVRGGPDDELRIRFMEVEALDEQALREKEVVFDLDRLRAHLRPEQVVEH